MSCSEPIRSDFETIDLRNAFAKFEDIMIADLGEHISYIPLETTDESLIGKRAYVRVLEDKILVGSFFQPIKMFDKKTGKFIRTVGNIGQGADEYTLPDALPVFWTDETHGIIYVQTEGPKILRFDVDGNPLSSVYLPDSFSNITEMSKITSDNTLYIYNQTLFVKKEYKLNKYGFNDKQIQSYILNQDEIITADFIQTPLFVGGFANIPVSPSCGIFQLEGNQMVFTIKENPCLWVYDQNVYLKENFNDTIYLIREDQTIPKLVFDLGNRHWPYKDRFNIEGTANKISIDYIIEGKNALFFVFQTNYYDIRNTRKTYLGVYNKNDKSVKVSDKPHILDSENNLFIEKLHTATADGRLIGLMDASSFIEHTKGNYNFEVSEEDNPIVVIIE